MAELDKIVTGRSSLQVNAQTCQFSRGYSTEEVVKFLLQAYLETVGAR